MGTPITFNELRRIKDQLPEGSMGVIAARLGVDPEIRENRPACIWSKGQMAA